MTLGACGGDDDQADDVTCPSTTTTGSTTTTLDPRCVVGAEEGDGSEAVDGGTWEGTIHSEGNAGGCLATWDGDLSFAVDAAGAISGEGTLSTTGLPGCSVIGGSAGTAYDEDFGVGGQLSEDEATLEFTEPTDTCLSLTGGGTTPIFCWGVEGGAVERTGDTVAGSFTTDLGPTTFETDVDLRCTTC